MVITDTYGELIPGFAVSGMTEEAAREIAKDEEVEYVEQNHFAPVDDEAVGYDGKHRNLGSGTGNWGLDRIDERKLPMDGCYDPMKNLDGSGITVYVIDSGIRIEHEEFEGRASWGTKFANGGDDTDCNGHGTHVAGIIGGKTYGVAPKANLVAVKVLECDNDYPAWNRVIAAVVWVSQRAKPNKSVVNMSTGGRHDRVMDRVVNELVTKHQVVMVAAARNYRGSRKGDPNQDGPYDYYRDACNWSPGSAEESITVGATMKNDEMYDRSNWGHCVDIWAPGQHIKSAFPYISDRDRDEDQTNTGTEVWTGTSMAAPFVAGAAALHLQDGVLAKDVKQRIIDQATTGELTKIGENLKGPRGQDIGSPNRLLYIGDGKTCNRRRTEEFLRGSK